MLVSPRFLSPCIDSNSKNEGPAATGLGGEPPGLVLALRAGGGSFGEHVVYKTTAGRVSSGKILQISS